MALVACMVSVLTLNCQCLMHQGKGKSGEWQLICMFLSCYLSLQVPELTPFICAAHATLTSPESGKEYPHSLDADSMAKKTTHALSNPLTSISRISCSRVHQRLLCRRTGSAALRLCSQAKLLLATKEEWCWQGWFPSCWNAELCQFA